MQFSSALTEADYRVLGAWFKGQPRKCLRVYGSYDGSIKNLDFLRWFPTLKGFQADVYSLENLDGLEHLPADLQVLGLGTTRKRFSLRPLSRFKDLRTLFLEGHTKDVEVVASLDRLVELTLRSITLPSLELLQPLADLRALDLKLGGTTNLSVLPTLASVRYLELWQVRGLDDITPAAGMPNLECLFLQSLRRVERLPDFSNSVALSRLWLQTMKGLSDLSILREAPNLRRLGVVDMQHLQPEDLAPLLGCPELRSVWFGLGSDKKNRRAREILGDLADHDGTGWDRS